jgi:hypothetical protein
MAWLFNGVHIAPKIKTLLLPTNQERIVSGWVVRYYNCSTSIYTRL